MPFPLIPIIVGAASAAGLGLQAYDTFGKKEPDRPITITTLAPTPQSNVQQNLPLIVAVGAGLLILALVIK